MENGGLMGFYGGFMGFYGSYPLVLTNIAGWKIHYEWRFLAGKIINGPFSMAMLNNQRVALTKSRKTCILVGSISDKRVY